MEGTRACIKRLVLKGELNNCNKKKKKNYNVTICHCNLDFLFIAIMFAKKNTILPRFDGPLNLNILWVCKKNWFLLWCYTFDYQLMSRIVFVFFPADRWFDDQDLTNRTSINLFVLFVLFTLTREHAILQK